MKSIDERKAILANQVARLVTQGWVVESASVTNSVLMRGRFLTRRQMVSVDDRGEISLEQFPLRRDQIVRLVLAAVLVAILILYVVVRAAAG